jgi:hypothetical protein
MDVFLFRLPKLHKEYLSQKRKSPLCAGQSKLGNEFYFCVCLYEAVLIQNARQNASAY